MKKLKVMSVVGTRPEIIRLSRVLARHAEHVLVHTGQNYDYELNQVFFDDLGVRKPDHFLDSAAGSEGVAQTIGNIIIAVDRVLAQETPEALLVLGETARRRLQEMLPSAEPESIDGSIASLTRAGWLDETGHTANELIHDAVLDAMSWQTEATLHGRADAGDSGGVRRGVNLRRRLVRVERVAVRRAGHPGAFIEYVY